MVFGRMGRRVGRRGGGAEARSGDRVEPPPVQIAVKVASTSVRARRADVEKVSGTTTIGAG